MSKQPRYDLKKAYDKHLTGKERLHYLENYEHDVHRRGEAGNYTGNHPKYSVSMMGDPETPMKKMDDDLKYMPVEDIAGQGTEGVNMKTNPIMYGNVNRPNPNNLDPSKYHPKADLTDQYPRRKESDPRSQTYQQILKDKNKKVDDKSEVATMKKNPIDMKKTPVKMKKSPVKMGHKSPAKMGHKSPAKMGHKSPAKMGHKSPVKALQFGRKN